MTPEERAKDLHRARGRAYYARNKEAIRERSKLVSKEVYMRRKLREAGLLPPKTKTYKKEAYELIKKATRVTIKKNTLTLHFEANEAPQPLKRRTP
jgi:hypothetical protein